MAYLANEDPPREFLIWVTRGAGRQIVLRSTGSDGDPQDWPGDVYLVVDINPTITVHADITADVAVLNLPADTVCDLVSGMTKWRLFMDGPGLPAPAIPITVGRFERHDGELSTPFGGNYLGDEGDVAVQTIPVDTGDSTITVIVGIVDTGGGGGPMDVDWDDIDDKPTTFPPSAHTHEIADVDGLSDALDDLSDAIDDLNTGGPSSWDAITGKPTVIAAGATQAEARTAIAAAGTGDLDDKADDDAVVKLTGDQWIEGFKIFANSLLKLVSTSTSPNVGTGVEILNTGVASGVAGFEIQAYIDGSGHVIGAFSALDKDGVFAGFQPIYIDLTAGTLRLDAPISLNGHKLTDVAAGTGANDAVTKSQLDAKESTANRGQANGYAPLDSGGKVAAAYLPASIMQYLGTWNATTNTPTLADGLGDVGDVYRVSVAGSRNLGSGSITFDVGDYCIYNGTTWEKSDTTDAVGSVAGLTGVISASALRTALSLVVGTNVAPATSGTSLLKGDGSGGFSSAASGTDYAPATSGTSLLKGNSTGGFANAASGTDYAPATSGTSLLKGNGTGGFSSAASGTDYAPATSGTSLLKGNGTGGFSSAASGTDYAPATSGSSLLKGNGTGGFSAAASGTDYAPATSGTAILKGSGSGGFSNATAGTDYSTPSGNETQTNKRITPRVSTVTSSATPTINTDNVDIFGLTGLAADITSFTTNLSGTPTNGQKLWIYIVGTAARAITWGSSFEASTVALPTTTVSTNRLDVGFVWNAATSKWRCVAVA